MTKRTLLAAALFSSFGLFVPFAARPPVVVVLSQGGRWWAPSRALGLVLALATLGCGAEAEHPEALTPRLIGHSPAPLSDNTYIALADPQTACIIESFEYRVVCIDPAGATVRRLGSQGEGPGEFRNPASIFRQSAGTVAVFDPKLARLTMFAATGSVTLSKISSPAPIWITALHGNRVHGSVGFGPRPNGPPEVENQVLNLTSGEIIWRRSIYETARTECGNVGSLYPRPGGGYVLQACKKDLVFLADLDSAAALVVESPAHRVELPGQRDVDAYLSDVARLGGGAVPPSAMEPYAAAFRERPKSWFHGPGIFKFDGQDRIWVATTRDRDTHSYFDIWADTEYLGAVQIRGRLMGYDLLDSTLAVLVERQPDQNGIAPRGIDWYDVADVDFGRN
ncbi:MAG: hypothetical protein OXH49_17430 [Gemmatimonadetes bacterium]|nr:hypothetical protein [Gemmatimonadota bacterium]